MSTEKANKLVILALTKGGAALATKLQKDFPDAHLFLPERLKENISQKNLSKLSFFTEWKKTVEYVFKNFSNIVFIMATGIVVRTIAPLLEDKRKDPAVVVLDELGRFPISLLSGHVGGANELSEKIAKALGVEPVITTATDVNKRPAVDMLAKKLNCKIEPLEKVKLFNRFLAEGEQVELYTLWPDIDYEGFLVRSWDTFNKPLANTKGTVVITNKVTESPQGEHIFLYPKNLVVGVGCRKGIPKEEILNAIDIVFKENGLKKDSIKLLASIDLKKEEKGIIEAAHELKVPFKTVSPEKIAELDGTFKESNFVKKITGVGGVCQPAAIILSKMGRIIVPKQKLRKITVAVAEEKFMW